MMSRQTRVGVRGDLLGLQAIAQRNEISLPDSKVLCKAAIRVDTGKPAVLAVHVIACAAGRAEAVGDQRMNNHRIVALHTSNRTADLLDPSSILMTRYVGQLDGDFRAPDTLDDV